MSQKKPSNSQMRWASHAKENLAVQEYIENFIHIAGLCAGSQI